MTKVQTGCYTCVRYTGTITITLSHMKLNPYFFEREKTKPKNELNEEWENTVIQKPK